MTFCGGRHELLGQLTDQKCFRRPSHWRCYEIRLRHKAKWFFKTNATWRAAYFHLAILTRVTRMLFFENANIWSKCQWRRLLTAAGISYLKMSRIAHILTSFRNGLQIVKTQCQGVRKVGGSRHKPLISIFFCNFNWNLEVTCIRCIMMTKWKFCLEWAAQREALPNVAPWGIHDSTHNDLVTATAAVVQWNAAINKPTSPLHTVGAWKWQTHKVCDGQKRKESSFLSRRSFPRGGLGGRISWSVWQVKIKDLGSILYISLHVMQRRPMRHLSDIRGN